MRKLPDFIDGFLEYTKGKGSPAIFRLWSAIFTISAAVERKVWIETTKGHWYPNQYILLVGPAGIGKTLCTKTARELLNGIRSETDIIHLAPKSVTRAGLADALVKAERAIVRPMDKITTVRFNSLIAIPGEFGVFLPSWDNEFMSTLTDIWDNEPYSESKRSQKIEINIPNAQLNLLSADTPAHLSRILPDGAWEEGFMSRTLLAYSNEQIYIDILRKSASNENLKEDLLNDLKQIYKLYGEFTFTNEAIDAFSNWDRDGRHPRPDHPKLQSYNVRRASHVLKLCMVASLSSDNEMIITLEHFERAKGWLEELEKSLPEIFKSLNPIGTDADVMQECWHYVRTKFSRTKEAIPEHDIIRFMQNKIPAHRIEYIINSMEKARILIKKIRDDGTYGYEPRVKGQ